MSSTSQPCSWVVRDAFAGVADGADAVGMDVDVFGVA
jgi:hypothetical protein